MLHREAFFSLALPVGFEITTNAPVEDFEIYTVSSNGQPFIGIYIGNQPNFPKLNASLSRNTTTFEVLKLKTNSVWESDYLVGREVLVERESSNGWPMYVHAWTAQLPPDQMGIADKILSSLVVSTR